MRQIINVSIINHIQNINFKCFILYLYIQIDKMHPVSLRKGLLIILADLLCGSSPISSLLLYLFHQFEQNLDFIY